MALLNDRVDILSPTHESRAIFDSILGVDWVETKFAENVDTDKVMKFIDRTFDVPHFSEIEEFRSVVDDLRWMKNTILPAVLKHEKDSWDLETKEASRDTSKSWHDRPKISVNVKNLYSIVFDSIVLGKIDETIPLAMRRLYPEMWNSVNFVRSRESVSHYGYYVQMICQSIGREYLLLSELLRLGCVSGATVVQRQFIWQDPPLVIFPEMDQEIVKESEDAFSIISLEIDPLIGGLPAMQSLQDVERIKANRWTDVQRLSEVLENITYSMREGDGIAVSKVRREVELASRDLARGHELERVNRWITYLSVPVGIVGALNSPVGAAGIGLAVVGGALQYRTSKTKKQNNWINVFRS